MATAQKLQTEALVVEKAKDDFKLITVTVDPVLRSDEVLVEMKYSGVCHTDIVFQRGLVPTVKFPAIFGHEGAGVVKAVGSGVKDKSLHPGDFVLLSFNACGKCVECSKGQPARCHGHVEINHTAKRPEDGSTPTAMADDGRKVSSQFFGHSSFCRLSVVKEACIVKCPYPESMAIFAPLGCGFQTGAGTIMNSFKATEKDSVVIFGLGSVGLTAVMAAAYLKVRQVIAVDLVPVKLKLAQELGATHTINGKDTPDTVAEIKRITEGGANYAMDCTGVVKVIENAIECLSPCGSAAIVGVPAAGSRLQLDPLTFLLQNKRLIGTIEGDSVPSKFIPQLMELHKTGNFPIDRLCKIYNVKDFHQALEDIEQGKGLEI
ncbi:hypothetical protein H2204_002947 [Knufia peltigerae]|uniref:Enoyl reductase (ER) domain-containing protein n=1 Tax=Knufia peltigerae TaxID=1002370 RepID=A0AA38YAQ7_9EURO|nr:hypothetical protein H2204_002947 [Knufia peltigerae]